MKLRMLISSLSLCCLMFLGLDALAQTGSRKPGSSSSRSSPPSSRPKFSAPSTPRSTPPSSSSKPKFSAPSTPRSTPPSSSSKPKFSAPGSSSSSSSSSSSFWGNSRKPSVDQNDSKARANRQEASRRTYVEQKQATSPPRPSYTNKEGHEIKIDPSHKNVEIIRNRPSREIDPHVRTESTVTHIHNHHYAHPYNYYQSQPFVNVGGGYSSVFWWLMMEWSAERRATWFYHNQGLIERAAYERGLQDAAVRAHIQNLEQQKVMREPGYIDPEFRDNPSIMFDQGFIDASYNPQIRQNEPMNWTIFGWICLTPVVIVIAVAIGYALYRLVFVKRFGK